MHDTYLLITQAPTPQGSGNSALVTAARVITASLDSWCCYMDLAKNSWGRGEFLRFRRIKE